MRSTPLLAAADAYRSAGDEQNELRVLSSIFSISGMDATRQQRYFQLLLARQPQELVRIASAWPAPYGEQAANYAVAHGSAELAHAVVQARGQARPPVWDKSYNALVGLYFAEPTPEVNNAFLDRPGRRPDRRAPRQARRSRAATRRQYLVLLRVALRRISRHCETRQSRGSSCPRFLRRVRQALPDTLTLADYYAGAGDTKHAIADYNHTLELSPNRPDVYDSLAVAYYKQGDRAAALAQWKQAFAALSKQLNSARVPESFWADFGRTCDQLPHAPSVRGTQTRCRCHRPHLSSPQRQLAIECSAAAGLRGRRRSCVGDSMVARSFPPRRTDPATDSRRCCRRLLDSARRSARRSISAFSQSKEDAARQTTWPGARIRRAGARLLASALDHVPGSHQAVRSCRCRHRCAP